MLEWTRKAGYEVSDFAKQGLRCIHVAGTKGKGSVCVMVENILLQYREQTKASGQESRRMLGKVGLYTSPHLITVRERIRIDGAPISELLFTRYFFEIWDRLSSAVAMANPAHPDPQSSDTKPGYFRFLTLLAFHTFMKEGVESAIIECGIGGEYDSTNILPPEAVTVAAITRLGIDHIGMLGETIVEIARHKAGIFKNSVPAFTSKQVPEAQAVLAIQARSKNVKLEVVDRHPELESGDIKLGLDGEFQKDNASLAIAVARSHMRSVDVKPYLEGEPNINTPERIPQTFSVALETVKWQGRCETRDDGNILWLMDGAHTVDSITETARWYENKLVEASKSSNPPTATMLIFNQQGRDTFSLISTLINNSRAIETGSAGPLTPYSFLSVPPIFQYAAFCTNTAFKREVPKDVDLTGQEYMASIYERADGNQLHNCYGSIEDAVKLARRIAKSEGKLLVLVTGSLHLVGGLIRVLDGDRRDLDVPDI